ncbi:MAG: alpha/beta hydrolase [Ilumatobacteraceae bacterium]
MARIAVVHGMGGTAATMQPVTDALAALGHEVVAVTLPGHGTDAADLVGVTWADWLAALPVDVDAVVGQSMGASLAFAGAAAGAPWRAVVAINPPYADEDVLEGLEWRQSRGHDWLDGPPLEEGEVGYARLPIGALVEMVRGVLSTDLGAVRCPVLLAHGAMDDSADPFALDALAASLGGPVTRLELPASGHVASLGPDVPQLAAAIDTLLA